MLAKLSLEQKIELLGGVDGMYTHPMPVIDLPRFKMSDASVGVRTWGPTMAYAGGVAVPAQRHDGYAHPQGFTGGGGAIVRSGVERDIDLRVGRQMFADSGGESGEFDAFVG